MAENKQICRITIHLEEGKDIVFCTDEWREDVIYERLTKLGKKIKTIDREEL